MCKLLTELSQTSTYDKLGLFSLDLADDSGHGYEKKIRLELMKDGT